MFSNVSARALIATAYDLTSAEANIDSYNTATTSYITIDANNGSHIEFNWISNAINRIERGPKRKLNE